MYLKIWYMNSKDRLRIIHTNNENYNKTYMYVENTEPVKNTPMCTAALPMTAGTLTSCIPVA